VIGAMDYDEYVGLTNEAARLDEAGDTAGALAVFQRLAEADLAEHDRSLMYHNVGVLLEKLDRPEEALAAYDRGIALETSLCRSLVAEQKAALLHQLGRNAESLSLYRWLESRRWASETEKHRFRHNISALSRA
jgi:tetratricopeptide (TPR) repeat protein